MGCGGGGNLLQGNDIEQVPRVEEEFIGKGGEGEDRCVGRVSQAEGSRSCTRVCGAEKNEGRHVWNMESTGNLAQDQGQEQRTY